MTVHPWINLQARMALFGIDRKQLKVMLGKCQSYISLRLNGHKLWSMEDALTMMQALKIRPDDFLCYFGRDTFEAPAFSGKEEAPE